jgi:hypothetical protein
MAACKEMLLTWRKSAQSTPDNRQYGSNNQSKQCDWSEAAGAPTAQDSLRLALRLLRLAIAYCYTFKMADISKDALRKEITGK